MTIDYNNEILQAMDYLIKANNREVSFDQTVVCEIVDDNQAKDGIYWIKYNNSKMKVTSLGNTKYKIGAKVYMLVPQGDFTQDKIIIGEYKSSEGSPNSYAIPSDQVIKITDNLYEKEIPNYDYGFGYKAKYILLSASFTNSTYTDEDYGLNLSVTLKDKNNIEHTDQNWGGLHSTNFYGSAKYADHSTQEILLALPEDAVLISTEIKQYGPVAADEGSVQIFICYDKNDVPADIIAISAYTDNRNQSYEYNGDKPNEFKPVDFYTKILYNQNVIEVDNNSNLLTDNDKIVWFKYELGYTSTKTGDELTWETLAGTNWAFQATSAVDGIFSVVDDTFSAVNNTSFATIDFNMATTQYKVMWIGKNKIYDKNGNETEEFTDWLVRAQDSVTFTNSARVVDQITINAVNNSRISLKINEDDNANFFVYGNDSKAVSNNRSFIIYPYFNDNTIPTSGTIKFYIPKNSSQIETAKETIYYKQNEKGEFIDKDGNVLADNEFDKRVIDKILYEDTVSWNANSSDDSNFQILSYNYDETAIAEEERKLPFITLYYKENNNYASNNTIKCEVIQNEYTHYTTRSLTFGNQNTAGTGYKLNVVCLNEVAAIKPAGTKAERTLTYQILLEDNNGNSLNNYLIDNDNYKDKIEINFVGAAPLKYTGFEISEPYAEDNKVLFNLVFGYNNISLDENGNPIYTFIDTDGSITKYTDKGVDTTINYDSVMIYNFSIFEVVVSKTALIGVNKPVNLRTKFPVAFRQDSVDDTWYAEQTALDGPTRVIYDNSYNNPTYDKKAIYQIHFKKIYTDGKEENGIWGAKNAIDYWRLFFIDNKGMLKNLDGGLSLTTLSDEEKKLIGDGTSEYWENSELKGGVKGDCRLSASDSLTSNFAYVNIGMSSESAWGNFKWSQPIIIETERYFTELINSWDGSSVSIDDKNGTILSQMVGAGYKNSDNQFSGVFMGKIGLADEDYDTQLTGLFGYQDGQLRFKFDEDGNAYIGNNNKGNYIDFTDGVIDIKTNKFTLESGNPNSNSYLYLSNTGKQTGNGYDNNFVLGNNLFTFSNSSQTAKLAGWTIDNKQIYRPWASGYSNNHNGVGMGYTSSERPAFWAGFYGGGYEGGDSPLTDSSWKNWTKFYVTPQGEFFCGSGNNYIKFDTNGDVTITGQIYSEKGEIGGWTITENGLENDNGIKIDSTNACIQVGDFAEYSNLMELNWGGINWYYGKEKEEKRGSLGLTIDSNAPTGYAIYSNTTIWTNGDIIIQGYSVGKALGFIK